MKKLILIAIASFFLVQVSNAQLFSYGIKAGLGFSSINMDDITGIEDGSDAYDLVTGDAVTGYHIGLQTRIKIAMVLIQPELYFNAGGGTVEQVYENGTSELFDVKFKTIDIPLLLGVKLGPARLHVGPVGSLVLSESTDLTELEPDFEMYASTMAWAYQAGVGLDLWKLSIDARYQGSLSAFGESITLGGTEFPVDASPSKWIISLGYWFK